MTQRSVRSNDAQLDVAKAQCATEPVVLGKPRGVTCLKEQVRSQSLDGYGLASDVAEGGQRIGGDHVHRACIEVRRTALALQRPPRRRYRSDESVELWAVCSRRASIGERHHRLAVLKMAAVVQHSGQLAKATS